MKHGRAPAASPAGSDPGARGRPFRWDDVIKVGGSLGRGLALGAILRGLARLARTRRILLIPGGGRFADLVRAERKRLGLDEASAHSMALRAMDQYGFLMAALCPRARATGDFAEARRIATAGGVPVFLASSTIERRRRLERTFRLTSDSIAAVVARRIRAKRLVLLKRCQCREGDGASRAALLRLARRGVVDPLFPSLAPPGAEIRILDVRSPRARALLEAGRPGESRRPRAPRGAPPGSRRAGARREAPPGRPGRWRRGRR